jgi:aspartate ammonia-lyase
MTSVAGASMRSTSACLNSCTLVAPGLVTALNPYIGYTNATEIAQEAFATGGSVAELVLAHGLLT